MRLGGAFVNIEHLALSLVGDQTGALRCKLKRGERERERGEDVGALTLLLGRMFGTSGASLWGRAGQRYVES